MKYPENPEMSAWRDQTAAVVRVLPPWDTAPWWKSSVLWEVGVRVDSGRQRDEDRGPKVEAFASMSPSSAS